MELIRVAKLVGGVSSKAVLKKMFSQRHTSRSLLRRRSRGSLRGRLPLDSSSNLRDNSTRTEQRPGTDSLMCAPVVGKGEEVSDTVKYRSTDNFMRSERQMSTLVHFAANKTDGESFDEVDEVRVWLPSFSSSVSEVTCAWHSAMNRLNSQSSPFELFDAIRQLLRPRNVQHAKKASPKNDGDQRLFEAVRSLTPSGLH